MNTKTVTETRKEMNTRAVATTKLQMNKQSLRQKKQINTQTVTMQIKGLLESAHSCDGQ